MTLVTFEAVQAGKRVSGSLRHAAILKLQAPFGVASASHAGSPSVQTMPRGRVAGLLSVTPSYSTRQSVTSDPPPGAEQAPPVQSA